MASRTDHEQHAHPLAMARALMHQVDQFAHAAEVSEDARIQSITQGWGNRQHQAAEMAAQMALVSIAEDIHKIAELVDGSAVARLAAALIRADRRAEEDRETREHMRRWADGEDHPGEGAGDD